MVEIKLNEIAFKNICYREQKLLNIMSESMEDVFMINQLVIKL